MPFGSYTPRGDTTQVDIEGEFPPMPGMGEADQLQMIEGFFTMTYAETRRRCASGCRRMLADRAA
jgi:hypothetical protein